MATSMDFDLTARDWGHQSRYSEPTHPEVYAEKMKRWDAISEAHSKRLWSQLAKSQAKRARLEEMQRAYLERAKG